MKKEWPITIFMNSRSLSSTIANTKLQEFFRKHICGKNMFFFCCCCCCFVFVLVTVNVIFAK